MLGEFSHGGKLYEIKSILDPIAPNECPFDFKLKEDVQAFFMYVMADAFTRKEVIEITRWFVSGFYGPKGKTSMHTDEKRLNQLYHELLTGDLILVQKRVVSLSKEQKKQCAKLLQIYTEIETSPQRWNEKSADLLAEMVWSVEECSRAMGALSAFFPKNMPPNLKPSWRWWLTNVIFDLLKNENKIRKGYVNTLCLNQAIANYKSVILDELIH